jgi:hypothetical protein
VGEQRASWRPRADDAGGGRRGLGLLFYFYRIERLHVLGMPRTTACRAWTLLSPDYPLGKRIWG